MALSYKDQGNERFKEGRYAEALALYNSAINVAPQNAVLYSNRSAAQLRLGDLEKALADAETCITLKPDWEKGYFRKGNVFEERREFVNALQAYETCLKLSPFNKEIVSKVKELRKKVKAERGREAPKVKTERGREAPKGFEGFGPGIDTVHLPGGASLPDPSGWANGLDLPAQYEWLVDCFRMRMDDEYAYRAHQCALYSGNPSKRGIAQDFLVFCKLAVRHQVIPAAWDWARFLRKAAELVGYAFEKSDAKEKYGQENFFSAITGGRSLRFTAEAVYRSGVTTHELGAAEVMVRRLVQQGLRGAVAEDGELFADVGGGLLWKRFMVQLELP